MLAFSERLADGLTVANGRPDESLLLVSRIGGRGPAGREANREQNCASRTSGDGNQPKDYALSSPIDSRELSRLRTGINVRCLEAEELHSVDRGVKLWHLGKAVHDSHGGSPGVPTCLLAIVG